MTPRFSRRRFGSLAAISLVAAACSDSSSNTLVLDNGGIPVPSPDGEPSQPAAVDAVRFAYEDFDGQPLSFDDFPPGPVVLNFFASWCPTCIAEMPDFETVHQNFAGEVGFIGIATQDRVENAAELVIDTGVTYPVGNDQNGDIFRIFNGLGMPTTVFINADRTVADVHTGVLNVESLTEAIENELL